MPKTITIPRTLANQILHQAQLSPTEEVYGLVGTKQQHCDCYPSHKEIARVEDLLNEQRLKQSSAFETMQAKQQELFAIYHLLPNAPQLPTQSLLASENSDTLYLSVLLNIKGVLEMRGFYWQQGIAEEVELIL